MEITFGSLRALEDVNFQLGESQTVGLIGPNGTGKTAVSNLLTQVYQLIGGTIELERRSIIGKRIYDVTHGGIARTFQNTRLLKNISILDDVRMATNYQMKYFVLAGTLRLPFYQEEECVTIERAMGLLSVSDLQEHAEPEVKNLSYGQQRKLEIIRTLVASPKVLLPDEPTADINPTKTHELMKSIQLIRDRFPASILLIEHDVSFVMGIYQHLVVLNYDRIIAEGSVEEVRTNSKMIAACPGGE